MNKITKVLLTFVMLFAFFMVVSCGGTNEGTTEAKKYSVTFETNGGSKITTIAVEEGKTFTLPENPTKEDYKFDGWYLDSALSSAYTDGYVVSANITLYAKWVERFTDIETIASTYKNNQEVETRGVVYAVTANGFYLADSANGHIFVVRGSSWVQDVNVGDKVEVVGKFGYAQNIIQIKEVKSCVKVNSGNTPAVVAAESSIVEVNALSASQPSVYGSVVTLTGTISKNGTMYALTDEDGKIVFFDTNSNEAALEVHKGQRVTLNAVVYKYLTSDNVWTLSYAGTQEEIVETPLTFDYVIEKALAHLNEVVAKDVYGALELPTSHDVITNITYSWAVEANDYLTIVDNVATIVIDSVDHEVVLKVTISNGIESETVDFAVTLKGIVEQTVSEFYANKPVVDDSTVILRGVIVSFARNQSESMRSVILKDPTTNETVPVDFYKNDEYILHTSEEFKALELGDEIIVTARYSNNGRPTIECVSKIEVAEKGKEVSYDFENAYVLDSEESYLHLAANVYDYSGQLVKFANPFLNYSTSSTPNDTNWVQIGYDEMSGATGYKVDGTARKFAFLIVAGNENLGSETWHKNYEIPFVNDGGKQFDLTIYAYCLYVSESYVAFIIPGQSCYKAPESDQIIMDLELGIPSSIETGAVTLLTVHEYVTGAITWTSSHPEIINATTGEVTEVNENTVVTLTATYTHKGEVKEYSIEITVLKNVPLNVSELLATGVSDVKYNINGVVVAFSSDGNKVEGVKGIVVMDLTNGDMIVVEGVGSLYQTTYPNYVDANGTAIEIGKQITLSGIYVIGADGRKSVNVSTGKIVMGEACEYAFNDEKAVVINSHETMQAFADNLVVGQLIKFVGTAENPIYLGGSSSTAPMNYKVFMSPATDNNGTKYNGKTFSFKSDVNEPNAGLSWGPKYLALPEAFVCPNSSNAARAVLGTIYGVVTHVTGSYYQMAIVNIENWTPQPELQYVKDSVTKGISNSVEAGELTLELPTSTFLTGAITWVSGSELIDLENKVVKNATESTEVVLTGTFTYAGETQTVEHTVTIIAGAPATISEVKLAEAETTVYVEGLVIGFGGNGTWSEIILKDTTKMEFIGLKSTANYAKGDIIRFNATVAVSTNTTEAGKKYLESPEGIEVVSSGNSTELDLSVAISITTQEELAKVHEGAEYVLYKLEGNMFGNMFESSKDFAKAYFRVNFVAGATKLSDIRFENEAGKSISAGFRNSYIAKNLGDNWAAEVFGVTEYTTGGYPGHAFTGTIYAMYVGGNDYYEQFTILDASHIIKG